MALLAPKVKRILPPTGTHIARCIRLLHIGTIEEEYMGDMKEQNKLNVTFELVDELHSFKDGEEKKPFVLSQDYTLSLGLKSNLRKIVEGMIGRALEQGEESTFDVESLLNKECLITIKHKTSKAGNERAEIASTSPLMKGQKAKEAFNKPKLLSYTSWDETYFESLPEFMQEKIAGSKEYKALKGIATPDLGNPEDVSPF